ncbi:MAG: sodium:solute symporter family protein [Muribaculaceae bacterium]|nr:sodium:solute symporter family protein [Muribaculaceae bacterium]
MISWVHLLGVVATVALLLVISWWSGRRVKDARTFITGGNSGSWMVCGAMLGTLAGGQSTIGTAQLAFCYGLSAWWFTIGAGLGALVLGLFFAGPLRRSGCTTLLEVVSREYGRKAETVGSILFLIGIFISIMSQVLSSSAMIGSLFGISTVWASVLGAVLIMLMVLFGGIRSAGMGGIVKLVLLYLCSLIAGIVVWQVAGGLSGLRDGVDAVYQSQSLSQFNGLTDVESIHHRYGSPFARGVFKDLGGCLSLILGVVCTQSYAQCIWSAASTPKARNGAMLCALFMPIIGAACTLVGIYMRGHYVTADEVKALQTAGETLPAGLGVIENSAQAFPAFILKHLPAWLGGLMLGTMLINILGCGSGLSLGAATILVRDVYGNFKRRMGMTASPLSQLAQTRLSIVGILVAAVIATLMFRSTFINDLGFLSLGLRAVAILFPLCFALWLPGRFSSSRVLLSMPVGVAALLLANFTSLPGDAVYYGLGASFIILLTGMKKHPIHEG